MKREVFRHGDSVEARRFTGDDWWPMIYLRASDHKGHHWVAEANHPKRHHLVSSRCIRKGTP